MNLSKNIIEYVGYKSGWSEEEISKIADAEQLTFEDVLWSKKFTDELKHWVYSMALLSEEDKQAYNDYFKLENSEYVFSSKKVKDSYRIFESENVADSQLVRNSIYVDNSYLVEKSSGIDNSQHIFNCQEICDSSNVSDSSYCSAIETGYWLRSCVKSKWLISCDNCINCYFCNGCKDGRNLICCFQFSNNDKDRFFIFNKEVPQEIWEQALKCLTRVLFDNAEILPELSRIAKCGSNVLFAGLKDSSIKRKLESLPNYNSMIMYNITLVGEFLTN